MSDETIVAVYDTIDRAQAAVASLEAAGVPAGSIGLHAASESTSGATTTVAPARDQGFWSSLFGGEPDHDTTVYDRSLDDGSTVISVKAPETHITQIMEILESHNPIDIDERAAGYRLNETTTAASPPIGAIAPAIPASSHTAASDEALQLAEERLAVGKRVVNRGGTRIRRFVVETPVEENVSLHSETVTLERHPVTDSRPVTDADFTEKTIEMTETAEEVVVSKTARVYEEVGLHKAATDRVETVRDTVRKEEVEVEQIPGTPHLETTTTTVRRDSEV